MLFKTPIQVFGGPDISLVWMRDTLQKIYVFHSYLISLKIGQTQEEPYFAKAA